MWSHNLGKGIEIGFEKEICVMRLGNRQTAASATKRMNASFAQSGGKACIVTFLLLVFALVLFDIPVVQAQQSSDTPSAGNAQNGKKLFNTIGCYECHGRQGQGATQTGAARIGPPM